MYGLGLDGHLFLRVLLRLTSYSLLLLYHHHQPHQRGTFAMQPPGRVHAMHQRLAHAKFEKFKPGLEHQRGQRLHAHRVWQLQLAMLFVFAKSGRRHRHVSSSFFKNPTVGELEQHRRLFRRVFHRCQGLGNHRGPEPILDTHHYVPGGVERMFAQRVVQNESRGIQ